MKQQAFLPGAVKRHWVSVALLAGGAAVWLLLPLLYMVHVEGFSASIASMAQHLAHDSIDNYDRQFPFNLEYFLTTRTGVVVALAAIYRIIPDAGEWAFRVVMLTGLIGIVIGTVALVRRWTGVGWIGASAALLLMPGVSESAFFYNDNVLSSGLAIVALAILACGTKSSRHLRALVCGVLLAAAVVSRSDAMLLAPAVFGILWLRRREGIGFVANLVLVGAGALAVFAALFAAFGFTVLDSLRIARHAVALWGHGESVKSHAIILTFFLGFPAMLLITIGAYRLLSRKDWVLAVTIVGMPLLYNLIYLGKAWEARALLPITPFFAALVCLGGRWVITEASRLERGAVAALFVIAFAFPPNRLQMHDGPRSWTGRLWAPVLWLAWQDERRLDTEGFDRLAASTTSDQLFITTNWNADRYLHLALQDAGFAPVDSSVTAARTDGCGNFVETMRRGDATVRHLRLHVPFIALYATYVPTRYEAFERSCPLRREAEPVYVAPSEVLRDAGLADRAQAFSEAIDTPSAALPSITTEPNAEIRLAGPSLKKLRSFWAEDAQRNTALYGATSPALLPPRLDRITGLLAPRLHER